MLADLNVIEGGGVEESVNALTINYQKLVIRTDKVLMGWIVDSENICNPLYKLQGFHLTSETEQPVETNHLIITNQTSASIPTSNLTDNGTSIGYELDAVYVNGSSCTNDENPTIIYDFDGMSSV